MVEALCWTSTVIYSSLSDKGQSHKINYTRDKDATYGNLRPFNSPLGIKIIGYDKYF